MFGVGPQLFLRPMGLKVFLCPLCPGGFVAPWGHAILQHLVHQVNVWQRRIGVSTGELDAADVGAALAQHMQGFGPRPRGSLLEEAEQVNQVGGRAIDRATMLAIAKVERAEQGLPLGPQLFYLVGCYLVCRKDVVQAGDGIGLWLVKDRPEVGEQHPGHVGAPHSVVIHDPGAMFTAQRLGVGLYKRLAPEPDDVEP